MVMPKLEEYVYHDGKNYVCSYFVIGYYKHGGLFGDLKLLPNEFSPGGLYTLDTFDICIIA